MKKLLKIPDILYAVLMLLIFIPGKLDTENAAVFIMVAAAIELYYLQLKFRGREAQAAGDIIKIVYVILIIWELVTTKFNIAHKTLVPCPENVFYVFVSQRELMIKGIFSSMQLLVIGFVVALTAGVGLGIITGWNTRLRRMLFPIAKVISPIPPIIYTPYVVALMPSFRSASAVVIILGIFWPTFMNTILRVGALEKRLLQSARALCLGNRDMITQVLLPYVLPGVVNGLRVTLSTSFLILTMAEMMGASSGLGYFIKNYSDYANYTNVAAGILLVGVVVTILNQGIGLLENKLIKWKE